MRVTGRAACVWETPAAVGAIFIWIGASAITLYLINGIVGFKPLATQLIGGDVGSFVDSHLTPGAGSFLAHAVGLLLAVALAGFLYQRKIFLRV
jgi:hypothetical protein